jgi:hypothetical protein
VVNLPNRNLLFYRHPDGSIEYEVVWKQRDGFPHEWWNCWRHPLCGHKMRRIHFTCMTGCRIRPNYNGQLPNPIPLAGFIQISVLRNRRFPRLKDALIKLTSTLLENLLAR